MFEIALLVGSILVKQNERKYCENDRKQVELTYKLEKMRKGMVK